jgi:hypothetical protein
VALAQFLTSKQAQSVFAKSGLLTPARIAVPLQADQAVFLQAIVTGKPTHPPVQWEAWQDLMVETLLPAFDGQQTVETATNTPAFRNRQAREVFSP